MRFEEFLAQFGIKDAIEVKRIQSSLFRTTDEKYLAHGPLWLDECIAHVRGERIIPSIDFLQWIAKRARRRVVVNAQAEWLFICGRDVSASSIIEHNDPNITELAVVLNERKECLGYGEVIAPLDNKRGMLRRVFDIGDLLRREHKRRV